MDNDGEDEDSSNELHHKDTVSREAGDREELHRHNVHQEEPALGRGRQNPSLPSVPASPLDRPSTSAQALPPDAARP